MAEPTTVCNKENGCFSQLYGINCPTTERMLGLIQACLMDERVEGDPNDLANRVWNLCAELKIKNREEWFPETIHEAI